MKRASCGLDVNFPVEICNVLKSASDYGYEFVCLPLAHPRFKREFTAEWKDRQGPFTRPDLVLPSSEWNSLVAGKVSSYINVESENLAIQSALALQQELNFGSHLDVPAILIPLRNSECYNLARIINSNLLGMKPYQVWVVIPMVSQTKEASVWRSDLMGKDDESTWEWWNIFRSLCNSDRRLGVVLEITKNLPPQNELERWLGEPIKCIVICTSIFLSNKKGYPVLPKPHQVFVKSLVPFDVQVVIKGNNHHFSMDCYQKYMDHLWREASVQQNSKLDLPSSENSLQYSLQTNDSTQEIDFAKYREYSKAVQLALLDLVPEEEKSFKVVNIMIIGTGKGALVTAVLEAKTKTDRKVKIFVFEKNQHAAVALQAYQQEIWLDEVEVIVDNNKFLNFTKKIDILISELLGSFGDNELLPEIFDDAQKYLSKKGICIPQKYTSYICPVQSFIIYSDVKTGKEKSECEIPYVVTQDQKYNISQPKALFSFHHPNYGISIENSRYKRQVFDVKQNCTLHGFIGFFSAALYKNVKLSTVPEFHTPLLRSWCPIFFPLLEPIQLKSEQKIEVLFWRVVGTTKIWYEWTIAKPISLPIHNPNGRSSSVDLNKA